MKPAILPSRLAALILATSLPACAVLSTVQAGDAPAKQLPRGAVAMQRLAVKDSPSRSFRCVALTRDENTIAISDGEEIHVWQVMTGKRPRMSFKAFYVSSMAFTPDGRQLLTSSHAIQGGITSYDPSSGRVLYQLSRPNRVQQSANPQEIAMAPEEGVLASCHHTDIRFLNLNTRRENEQRRIQPGPNSRFVCLTCSTDGKLLVGGTSLMRDKLIVEKTPGARAHVWDVASGERILSVVSGSDDTIEACAFSGDGRLLVCSGYFSVCRKSGFGQPRVAEGFDSFSSLHLWEIVSGKVIFERDVKEGSTNHAIACSADGRLFATVGNHRGILLWDAAEGIPIHEFDPGAGAPQWWHFTSDGKRLLEVHGFSDGPVLYVWDLDSLPKPRADKPRPTVEALWADLASSEVRPARRAVRDLTEQPDRAVPFLAKQLRPVPGADDRTIERLISDLDSFRFPIRQTAENRLELLARRALPALKKAAANPASVQHGRIIDDLLRRIGPPYTSPERLRRLRAIEVLEHIGSSDAQNVLIVVASGAAQVPETEAARASLARLAARTIPRP